MIYRWYDAHDVTPLFPFGHGLSYTTFQYSNMSIIITNPSEGVLETANVISAAVTATATTAAAEAAAATTAAAEAAAATSTSTVAIFETEGHVEDEMKAAALDNKAIIRSKSLPSNPLSPPIFLSPSLPPPPITSPNRFDSLLSITIRIKNSGAVPGTEIVQLYMSYPDTWGEPLRQLKGISTVSLQPNESSDVKFNLSSQDLSFWDKDSHQWALPCSYKEMHKYDTYVRESSSKERSSVFDGDCTFDFFVGASSRDFRAEGSIQIKQ
jgi:Fibronectin type III-like domain